jgi:AP-2 complex subunit alpha
VGGEDYSDDDSASSGEEGQQGRGGRRGSVTKDMFGLDDVSFGETTDTNAAAYFPAQPDVKQLYRSMSGVLYTSDSLVMSVKMLIDKKEELKMVLYYKNDDKNGNAISQVSVTLTGDSKAQFALQIKPTTAFELPSGGQVTNQMLLWKSRRPFVDSPQIEVNFSYMGAPQKLTLTLPVLLTHFTWPQPVQDDAFVAVWQKTGNEILKLVKLPQVMDKKVIANGCSRLRLEVLTKWMDKGQIFAVGKYFSCTEGANGQKVTMPVMIRLETKPNIDMVRLTIRSGYKVVSEGMLHAFLSVFQARAKNV